MTKLKASCGCGWVSVPVTQGKSNTVVQAQQHSDATGHCTEIHGIVRPTRRPLPKATSHGAGVGAPSGNGGPKAVQQ